MSEPGEFLSIGEEFHPDFLTPAQHLWKRRAFQSATPLDWGGMILRPGSDCHRIVAEIDCLTGIYGLVDSDGWLLYIGKSSNIPLRIVAHRKGGAIPFAAFGFIAVPDWACEEVEIAHIHALEPEFNKSYRAGSWPGHAQMMRAIRQVWNRQE